MAPYDEVAAGCWLLAAGTMRPAAYSEQPAARCLAASFDLGGDEADLDVGIGAVGQVNHLRHVTECQAIIGLHEHDFLRARLEDIGQAPLQIVPRGVVLIDLQIRAVARALDDLYH